MTHRIRLLLLAGAALGVLGLPTTAFAQNKLIANVGLNDSSAISLTTEAGAVVRDIPAGTYTLEVNDHSDLHNFHLTGTGLDMSTTVGFIGTVTWTVTFRDKERYRFNCDAHPTTMRGSFTIGGGPPPPPPPPPPKPKAKTLTATVGPGYTISLRTSGGGRVTRLKAGRYRIVVRDRSSAHSFHLKGPGVNKRTAVAFRGTATWTLTLRRGSYRYFCDPHAGRMRGSFRVT